MDDEQSRTGPRGSNPADIAEGLPRIGSSSTKDNVPHDSPSIQFNDATAMEVFFAWEKLRVVYNLFSLATMCVAPSFLSFPPEFPTTGDLRYTLFFANLFVCFGPVGESYLYWFGVPRRVARIIVYVVLSVMLLIWFFRWAVLSAF